MTPAEALAKRRPRKRDRRNHAAYQRTIHWDCKLREVRNGLRLAMHEVAKAVGLSSSSYWQIELGGDVRLTNAKRIAEFFGKTIDELWQKRK